MAFYEELVDADTGAYKFLRDGEWRVSTSGGHTKIENPSKGETAFRVQGALALCVARVRRGAGACSLRRARKTARAGAQAGVGACGAGGGAERARVAPVQARCFPSARFAPVLRFVRAAP
jgi:hypothetical protein